jgi:hypothetical protein
VGNLFFIAPNVLGVGEGGDFNHKYQCGERMLNIAENVERSTAPPLLPNVCYAFGFIYKLKKQIK